MDESHVFRMKYREAHDIMICFRKGHVCMNFSLHIATTHVASTEYHDAKLDFDVYIYIYIFALRAGILYNDDSREGMIGR